jgi:hypothetical protein
VVKRAFPGYRMRHNFQEGLTFSNPAKCLFYGVRVVIGLETSAKNSAAVLVCRAEPDLFMLFFLAGMLIL